MKITITIDAGEREAEFVRRPLTMTLGDDPSAALVDHLVEAYDEARDWLERPRRLTGEDAPDAAAR